MSRVPSWKLAWRARRAAWLLLVFGAGVTFVFVRIRGLEGTHGGTDESLHVARILDPLGVAMVLFAATLAISGGALRPGANPRRAKILAWLSWTALYAASCPVIVNAIITRLEPSRRDVDRLVALEDPARLAIVVLSAGFRSNDPDAPASERIDGATQARVLTAARLFERTHAAMIIASGGPPDMAAGMRELLLRLGVPQRSIRIDPDSANTRESAERCRVILRELELDKVVLVTSALHIPRAARYFERSGVTVISAPSDTLAYAEDGYPIMALYPSTESLVAASLAMHELFGRVEQALRPSRVSN